MPQRILKRARARGVTARKYALNRSEIRHNKHYSGVMADAHRRKVMRLIQSMYGAGRLSTAELTEDLYYSVSCRLLSNIIQK